METLINFYHERPEAFLVIAVCLAALFAFAIYASIPVIREVSQRIKRRFTNPFDVLAKIQDWQKLAEEIRPFESVENGIDNIVPFFRVVSGYQDRRHELTEIIDYLQQFKKRPGVDQLIRQLSLLDGKLNAAGRVQYGWNRTEPGEIVTEEKVFLGDIFGLFTHPVSFWKQDKDEPKGGWEGGTWSGHPAVAGKNAYDVVSEQARRFIRAHAPEIRQTVETIFSAAQIA